MSGVACGFLLSLPLSPLATCGHSGETVGDSALPAFVAMAIVHAAIVFWLGDHVQARWALLVSLVGHLHAASGSPTPEMCWAMFGVFVGFCAGVSCSIVSLLLPFPRLASEQMASRIGESHRQVMRYHAVLSCAFVVEARPHVLYSRADRLEELLTASLKNLANLARVARWERFLLPTIDTQLLSSHATLLFDLAHNLHRRNEAKRAFDRGASAHKRLALESASLIHEVVRHAAHYSKLLSTPLVKELPTVAPEDAAQRRERYVDGRTALLRAWRDTYAAALSVSPPRLAKWSPSSSATPNLNHAEHLLLMAQFDASLLKFDASLPRADAAVDDPMCKPDAEAPPAKTEPLLSILFPGAHTGDPPAARLHLALRTAIIMVASASLPWTAGTLLRGRPTAVGSNGWVESDLVVDFAIFCPIAVIFVYEHRQLPVIASAARLWRFVLGTFLGCVWALWVAACIGADALGVAVASALAAAVGTYLHAGEYFGYMGLCMAFTAPLIAVGEYWGTRRLPRHERLEQRSLARMIETANGAFLVVIATVLWPSSHLRAEPLLAVHLGSCLRLLRASLLQFVRGRRYDGPHLAARGRDAHRRTREMRSLLHEASLEPSFGGGAPLPRIDYEMAIGSLCQAEGAWLRMLRALEAMRAAAGRDGDDGGLVEMTWLGELSSRRNGSRDASPSVDGGSDKGGPHGGRSAAERLLARFQSRATTMLERATEVVDHMATLVEPPPPPDAKGGGAPRDISALPPTLHVLQGEIAAAWDRFDSEWTPLLAEELKASDGLAAAAQADAFARWLELLQAHVQLFALCRDVGAAAERLANVVLKQQPNAELLPRPRDLYSHQLVV